MRWPSLSSAALSPFRRHFTRIFCIVPALLLSGLSWSFFRPMRFQTVLFDLDGTLIDHLPAIHRCYVHTLPQLGLPAPTREEVRHAIGGGLENAMRRFVSEADLPARAGDLPCVLGPDHARRRELMPGADELLRALHAYGATLSRSDQQTRPVVAPRLRIPRHPAAAPAVFSAPRTRRG